MMPESITALFTGDGWLAVSAELQALPSGESWGPALAEGQVLERVILPLESLLVRRFELPLKHPRLLDHEILGQEIDEMTGEEPQDWWLVWQAATKPGDDEKPAGVSGMMFGMPVRWKRELDALDGGSLKEVVADAWIRLGRHLPADAQQFEALAVFDADADGLFFGVWQPLADGGCWRGMRRLNRQAMDDDALAEDCLRSLRAMGWDHGPAIGLLDSNWKESLIRAGLGNWQGHVAEQALSGRHQCTAATLTDDGADRAAGLNFRSGRWAPAVNLPQIGPWKRSLALAAALLLLWCGATLYRAHQLEHRAEEYRSQIEAAFHQGLPDEPVIVDALAQLRRAAGAGAGAAAGEWMRQLGALNRVYAKAPWTVRELEWRDGSMSLAGQAKSLEVLNGIRASLQQESGREVNIIDTDLSGSEVSFRMSW